MLIDVSKESLNTVGRMVALLHEASRRVDRHLETAGGSLELSDLALGLCLASGQFAELLPGDYECPAVQTQEAQSATELLVRAEDASRRVTDVLLDAGAAPLLVDLCDLTREAGKHGW